MFKGLFQRQESEQERMNEHAIKDDRESNRRTECGE